jgi:hypothetical protein
MFIADGLNIAKAPGTGLLLFQDFGFVRSTNYKLRSTKYEVRITKYEVQSTEWSVLFFSGRCAKMDSMSVGISGA